MQALATWPAPESPISVTDLPIFSSSGFTFSKASGVPPAMMVSAALIAPISPPDTGASTKSMPFSARRRPMLRAAFGIDGRHVDHDQTRLAAGRQAVGAEADVLDVGRVGDHDDHHLGMRGDCGRAWRAFSH